jgi:hypothetical protein
MSAKIGEDDGIDEIVFAGHGAPGDWLGGKRKTILKTQDLENRNSPQYKILMKIRAQFYKKHEGIDLQMCNQAYGAKGKKFMKLLAEVMDVTVEGCTGSYEARPTGWVYVARPPEEDGGATIKATRWAGPEIYGSNRNKKVAEGKEDFKRAKPIGRFTGKEAKRGHGDEHSKKESW